MVGKWLVYEQCSNLLLLKYQVCAGHEAEIWGWIETYGPMGYPDYPSLRNQILIHFDQECKQQTKTNEWASHQQLGGTKNEIGTCANLSARLCV